jgi:hypothetical protein
MIDMINSVILYALLNEYGWEVWWKALIVVFLLSWISVKMEKFCGFR